MIKIDAVETYVITDEGMTIKQGENEVFMTWEVINNIGEESHPMLFSLALKEVGLTVKGWEQLKIMQQQKTLN